MKKLLDYIKIKMKNYTYIYECTLSTGIVVPVERKKKIKTKSDYDEVTDMVRTAIKQQNKDTEIDTSRFYIIYMIELKNK